MHTKDKMKWKQTKNQKGGETQVDTTTARTVAL